MSNYNYNADSIEQLSFREAVRKRVGMYLGSSDSTGVLASLLEIVNNATDEYLQKKSADLIEITLWNDRVSVRDYGRGIPVGKNAKSEEVLITLLTENHSGAKFNANAYGGKALPNSTLLPTPNGFKQVGDVVVGDYLFDALGKPTEVIAVHPQKEKKQKWTVKLSDGREVICSPDHLWSYVTKSTAKVVQEKRGFRTSTTKELYERGVRVNQKQGYRFKIPVQKAVEYTAKEYYLDPYLMGLALGDGSFREHYTNKQFSYSSADEELVLAFSDLMGWEYKKDKGNNYSWTFKDKGIPVYVASLLTECPELINTYSHEKFIPQDYLFGSIKQRIDLLNGLLDSDGSIDKNGHIDYHTNSDSLKEDFIQLCDSLGLMTTTYLDTRKNTSNVWKIRVFGSLEIKSKLFRLKRKKEILNNWINNGKAKRNHNYVQIVDIVPSTETTDMTCFEVDNEEHLFLTDRFVPTHNSRGLHGTGASATNLSADWFEVTSYRDGFAWHLRFEEGIPTTNKAQKQPLNGEKDGTFIYYKPSQDVFKSEKVHFDFEEVAREMEEYSFFNKGITFKVTNGETGETRSYLSKKGLLDFAKKEIPNPLNKEPIHVSLTEDDTDLEIIAQWSADKEHEIILFSNGGRNPDGGTPVTGIKTSLTNFFKGVDGLNADLATRGLIIICSINLANPEYDGQTKVKIKNSHLRGLAQRAMNQGLKEFKNTREYSTIIDYLKRESAAEVAAQKAREAIRQAEGAIKEKIISTRYDVTKLKDAKNLGESATLYIVEGDGAAGVGAARDTNRDGMLAIRGKSINPLKNDLTKVYQNDEVGLLLKALGVMPGHYSSKKLRYGNVVILADSDADGDHITLLLLNIFQELLPEMLQEKRVHRLVPPSHIRHHNGKDTYYYEGEVTDEKGDLALIKGIGQINPTQAADIIFGKSAKKQTFEWNKGASKLLRELLGKEVAVRKQYVMNEIDFDEVIE